MYRPNRAPGWVIAKLLNNGRTKYNIHGGFVKKNIKIEKKNYFPGKKL